MSTEITSFQSHGDSDEDALIAQSHKGLIDFVIADHTRAYFQNHMYPIFLQDLQITFVGPLWVSARHIGLHLTGKFPAKQILNSSNQGSLKVAVIDFLSSPPSQGTMLSDTKDSDVFISQLVLSEGVSQAPEIRGRDANRNLNVTLKFDLTFFQQLPQKMQSQGYGALSYRDSVISRFNTETQQFLFEFLKTSGPFFEGVSNARAVDNIDFPTQDPEILQPALEPSSKNPSYKSFLSKTGNSFDVRFATILMVLVPIIILVIGGALVLYLQRKKKRVK